MSPENSVPDHQ